MSALSVLSALSGVSLVLAAFAFQLEGADLIGIEPIPPDYVDPHSEIFVASTRENVPRPTTHGPFADFEVVRNFG